MSASQIKLEEAFAFYERGQLAQTKTVCEQLLLTDPACADALHLLGIIEYQSNHLQRAVELFNRAIAGESNRPAFYVNRGNALLALERFNEAVDNYDHAIAIRADLADAYFNRGNALYALKEIEAAISSYDQAIRINPNFAQAFCNRGNALQVLERFGEAIENYDHALSINANYVNACFNRGKAQEALNQFEKAVESYRRAIVIKPDYLDAYLSGSAALQALGLLSDAEAGYRKALALNPNLTTTYFNLSRLQHLMGKTEAALETIQQSLKINETIGAKLLFVQLCGELRFQRPDAQLRLHLTKALSEPWGKPFQLIRASIDFLMLETKFKDSLQRANHAWPKRLTAAELFGSQGLLHIAKDPLLIALLDATPIADVSTERFLTLSRHALLETAIQNAANIQPDNGLDFYAALARQCFITDYIYACLDDEMQKADELKNAVLLALENNREVNPLCVAAVAAYVPLYSIPGMDRLLAFDWPAGVKTLLTQQLREPQEEQRLQKTIRTLSDINNEVSLAVQKQYEEHPYPRWIKSSLQINPKTVNEFMRDLFPSLSFAPIDEQPQVDILIAGCGTGQHSIDAAYKFKNANILAIDLSLSSLGYAKRKTLEADLNSIEYAQADLMSLSAKTFEKKFDVIESVGVLHHLAQPWVGCERLLQLLNVNGFMKLGLYSKTARRHFTQIKTLIGKNGYGSTNEEIRRFRQDLIKGNDKLDVGNTFQMIDFYNTGTCRDLFFHVQEHCMTLPDIADFLKQHSLRFMGFEMDGQIIKAYKKRFPDDKDANDLNNWHIYEQENPDTFVNMYQCWVQKTI